MLEDLPNVRDVLSVFTTDEVRPWREFEAQFSPQLRATAVFADTEQGNRQWGELRDRIIEHVRFPPPSCVVVVAIVERRVWGCMVLCSLQQLPL